MTDLALGFVGLGHMGSPMAARLVEAGYEVLAFDAAGTRERMPAGSTAAETLDEIAAQADIAFLSLPQAAASLFVCRRFAAFADSERRIRTIVDLSTIGIPAARSCGEVLHSAGISYVDAPVSGGVAGARAGSLTIMVAAPELLFRVVSPVLAVLGSNCFRLGDEPGQGQAMKLVNNFLNATALAATSEAVLFGEHMGLALDTMIDVLNASTGRTSASADKFPRSIIPGTYEYGFAGALMAKDTALYLESVEAAGTPGEIGKAATELWQRFDEACPNADFTYIYKFLSENGST